MAYVSAEEVLKKAHARAMPRVLAVTALGKEIRGVLAHLKIWGTVRGRRGGVLFECGEFNGENGDWLVIVAQSGPGNEAAQAVTLYGHVEFDRFDCMMFIGVAGSRKKDVPIGSVIASNRIYSPYSGKLDVHGFSLRPRSYEVVQDLVQLAMKVERDEKWVARILPSGHGLPLGAEKYPQPFPPIATVAPIVSVDSVMANPESDLEQHIARFFGDATGVEMEGFGATFGAHAEHTPAIVIRGVSDMTSSKTAKKDAVLQPIAVSHACAFAFEMLNLWTPDRLEGVPPHGDHASPLSSPTGEGPIAISSVEPGTSQPSRAPPGRFVLNFAGSAKEFPRPRLEAILAAVREATGDPTVEILDIEEGSVRIILAGATAQLERIHADDAWKAIEAAADTELFGVTDEAAYRKRVDDLLDLKRASLPLLTWPQTLPGGAHLERPELEQLLVKTQHAEGSATVVLGGPGAGKSAFLAAFSAAVSLRGWPVLAIKADVLEPSTVDESDLQAQLGLREPPSSIIDRLAAFGPVAIVIDQLDALAGFVDLKTGRLNVLLNMIRRFGHRHNVHIVLSARTFEFEHDVRLRSIKAESLYLELPSWRDVLRVLTENNMDAEGWPPDAQETLRTPQHLATFLRLAQQGSRAPFHNYHAMLERVWTERVLRAAGGERLARLATNIAETMAAQESLWLAAAKYDEHVADLLSLERLDVLTRSGTGGAIGFTHQTLYDFVLARSFARGEGRLSAYVAGREASLFLRPKLWAALNYLRDVEPSTYAAELGAIWTLPKLRPHLRLLLVDFMGMQPSPLDIERKLLVPLLREGPDRAVALRAVIGSSGWFDILAHSEIPRAMREAPDTAIARLIGALLARAWKFAPDDVTTLLETHWALDAANDTKSWNVIQNLLTWTDRVCLLAITILRRTDIDRWSLEYAIAHIGVDQPLMALQLVKAKLDRVLDEALQVSVRRATNAPLPPGEIGARLAWNQEYGASKPIRALVEDSQSWDFLASLAEKAPRPFLDTLWEWFLRIAQELANLEQDSEGQRSYPPRWALDFRFEADGDEYDLPEANLLAGYRVAAEALAKGNPEEFRAWMRKNYDVELRPVQRLIAHAMACGGDIYADEAFDFLMADYRRFDLGGYRDRTGTTKALIRSVGSAWSKIQLDAFVRRVLGYRPSRRQGAAGDAQSRRVLLQSLRMLKLGLLRALPMEKLGQEARAFIQREARVFPDDVVGTRYLGGGVVGPPMSSENMTNASVDDILKAFREVPDSTGWDHPNRWMMGGNVQLSRAFAEFAKHHPERAALIIKGFAPHVGERAAGYALDSLAEAADPSLVLRVFIDGVDRGFDNEEFRASAARALERLVDRNEEVNDRALAVLESWLVRRPRVDAVESTRTAIEDYDSAKNHPGAGDDSSAENFRSVLWDSAHVSVLPDGNYPVLHALTRVLLWRKNYDRLVEVWEAHLGRPEDPKVWQAMLRLVPFITPTDKNTRARLIRRIFDSVPSVTQTREAAHLLAYAHWWANEEVRAVLDGWQDSDQQFLRQAFGELTALIALVQPALPWASNYLHVILSADGTPEGKSGAAFAAVNLWSNHKFRTSANKILLALIPDADARTWSAVFDLFRLVEEFSADVETFALLDMLATHVKSAGRQTTTFILERLEGLLPYAALTIGRLVEGLIETLSEELGDMRTGSAMAAPDFVNLAITLHRLGGDTRELGTRLFEELLRIDAYSARDTLEQIDSRFRTGPVPLRRSRLPRRQKRRPSARGLT